MLLFEIVYEILLHIFKAQNLYSFERSPLCEMYFAMLRFCTAIIVCSTSSKTVFIYEKPAAFAFFFGL